MKSKISLAIVGLMVVAALTSACSTTTTANEGSSTPSNLNISYDGPEKDISASVPKPTNPASGAKIGYLQIYTGVSTLVATQDAMQEAVEGLGGEFILKDANLNAQTQVSQFNELLSQGVDAIIVFPVDPAALAPALEAAAAAGIPVIAQNATVSADEALPSGYVTTVNEALDSAAYAIAQRAAQAKAGGSVAVLGTSIPIPTVQYQVAQLTKWAKRFGLNVLGQVDNQQDNPGGYSQAATTLAAKYSNADFVFAYNDPYALTAAQVLSASGLTETKVSTPIGGGQEGFDAVKAGRLDAAYAIPWGEIGTQSVYAAYQAIAGADVPPVVVPQGVLVTSANVDSVPAA